MTVSNPAAKSLLDQKAESGDPSFWEDLRSVSTTAQAAPDVITLSALRQRAERAGLARPAGEKSVACRVALLAAYTTYPLSELLTHLLATSQPRVVPDLFLGDFDNYAAEIMEPAGALVRFKPDVIVILPSVERCRFDGMLAAPAAEQKAQAVATAREVLSLATLANQRTGSRVVLGNFMLPAGTDPGAFRGRSLGTDWAFRKLVNLTLGEEAPGFVTLCDLEFLSARRGVDRAADDRAWFESKQLGSSEFLVDTARDLARLISDPYRAPAKVVALDLDNTLWGGIIGDDGVDGIVLGGTSVAGEAYKAFQRHVLALKDRGLLLAVVSKNSYDLALEPFKTHPEMVIRLDDIVSFKANWEPKPDNLRAIAGELNLGLDSFVFIDDTPAEIEHVRQVLPEVHCILLNSDPALRLQQLRDSDVLHVRALTEASAQRTEQYRVEAQRQELEASAASYDDYLRSLSMVAEVRPFRSPDIARIAELIARSNQFNLTTIRRQESDLSRLMADERMLPFTIRLRDRFGDYGLISVVIGRIQDAELVVDTWLMSCRALKRQVEQAAFNELLRLARLHGLARIRGVFVPTPKNAMVRDHYSGLGYDCVLDGPQRREFLLDVPTARPFATQLNIQTDTARLESPAPPAGPARGQPPPSPVPAVECSRPSEGGAVRPGVEAAVAAIWGSVFGVPPPGRTTTFFELGGDSLQAMRIHLLLRDRFPDRALTVADLYRYTTVASLATFLGAEPDESVTSDVNIRPEPVYFGSVDRPLFGMFHHAVGSVRGAVVCCYPMPPKYQRSYRLFHQFAEELSGRGYDVLRFDYSGTGDSSGDSSEASLERWVSEVEAAANYLRSRTSSSRVSLVGMRIGAALAAQASRRMGTIDRLVLWEPAVIGAEYLEELMALNEYHTTGADSDESLDFHGFLVSPGFRRDLTAVSLLDAPPVASRILLIESEERPASRQLEARVENLHRETVAGICWDTVLQHDQIVVAPAHLRRIIQFLTEQAA